MINPTRILKSNLKPGALPLFNAWLLLVLIPATAFIFLFEHILDSGEKYLQDSAKIEIISEMNNFREDISCKNFLHKHLKRIEKRDSFLRLEKANATEVRTFFEKQLGFPVLAVFSQDAMSEVPDYSILEQQRKSFLVSRTMLKSFFKSLKTPEQSPDEKQIGSKVSVDEIEKQRNRSVAFIKSMFRIAGEFHFENGEIQSAISGKAELKKIFFYYHHSLARSHKNNSSQILIVFRENDIPVKTILQAAASTPSTPEMERKYTHTILNKKNITGGIDPFFSETPTLISFKSNFPEEMLRRLIGKGTYYPFNLEAILEKCPLLQVSAKKSEFQHPLRRYLKPFKTICLLAIIFIGVVLLRFYFFGNEVPFKLRTKILTSVLFAAVLPFSALYLVIGYHEDFRRNFVKFEIINQLNQQVDEFNIALNSYRNDLEKRNTELCEKLNFLQDYEFVPFLSHWLKDFPIANIVTRINHNDGLIARTSHHKLENFEVELKDFLFTIVENTFRSKKADGSKNDGSIGLFRLKIKGVGIFLSEIGLIHNSSFSNLDTLYSLIPVFPNNDRFADVSSAFLLKYSTRLLLRDFFNDQPRFIQNEEKTGFRIRKCFIPLENQAELSNKDKFLCDESFPRAKVIEKARKILKSGSEETWVSQRENHLEILHIEYSHLLNCIVVLLAEELDRNHFTILPSVQSISLYSFALILLIIVLMGKFFIEPVRLLQQSAESVALGRFDQRIELNSGDEFETLTEAFNEMVKGLDEREKLSSFVSENVINETADASELILVPGGERTHVSVLFCSLPDLKKYFGSDEIETLLSYLGSLIDCADSVSRRHGGIIDKIIEGTVMIVFRQRDAGNSHTVSACRAALEISAAFPQNDCPLRICAGIATGEAVSGKIGSKDGKLDYTVIGNPVNLAARLKSQAHLADQTGILLCPNTIRMLKGLGKLRFIERVEIKGRTRTFPMYELLALRQQ